MVRSVIHAGYPNKLSCFWSGIMFHQKMTECLENYTGIKAYLETKMLGHVGLLWLFGSYLIFPNGHQVPGWMDGSYP